VSQGHPGWVDPDRPLAISAEGTDNRLGQLGTLAVLLVGGWLVIVGEGTIGTVVAFPSGFARMTDPARELSNFDRRLTRARVQFGLLQAVA
jgi:ABC-type bacteriocin/lantibiotic exporter with double-glycine peptidase domain